MLSLSASDLSTAVKEYRIEQTNIIPGEEDTIDIGIFSNMTDMATWDVKGNDGKDEGLLP